MNLCSMDYVTYVCPSLSGTYPTCGFEAHKVRNLIADTDS